MPLDQPAPSPLCSRRTTLARSCTHAPRRVGPGAFTDAYNPKPKTSMQGALASTLYAGALSQHVPHGSSACSAALTPDAQALMASRCWLTRGRT